MNYFLFKLSFSSPVHFGSADSALSLYYSEDHFHADTLFSCLCHEALRLSGNDGLGELVDMASKRELQLSDGMIWPDEDFYIPRPFFSGAEPSRDISAGERKAMKKLSWIPAGRFSEFSDSVHGGVPFDVSSVRTSFGVAEEMTRVALSGRDESLPYQVGTYRFHQDCGLYIIAGCKTEKAEKMLRLLLTSAGLSGIGGKTGSGFGKFAITDDILLNEPFDEQTEWLFNALSADKAEKYLLITSSVPNDNELDDAVKNASYQLIRRSGFVQSASFSDVPLKKKTEFFFSAGSVFTSRYMGAIRQVGIGGNHPVYRYSSPLFLGVAL